MKMLRLVLSVFVFSFLIFYIVHAHPADEWGHPITFKDTFPPKNDHVDGSYRLSGDIIPINYNIWIQSRIHTFTPDYTFTGLAKITIKVMKSTSQIILHALRMKVLSTDLMDLTNNDIYYLYHDLNTTTDFLTLEALHTVPLNLVQGREYLLTIAYEGVLRQDNGGFYVSTYVKDNGKQGIIATTQFEATDARHAFPCFDEPGYKATFDIAITHGNLYNALSNMPVQRQEVTSETTKTTYFQRTPSMSTYLVAFIISDFESSESTQNGVMHRVFSRPEAKTTQLYGLQTSRLALDYLATYSNITYDLPKLDNIAIPGFGAGAMENWGLVTYREEYLLFDQNKSTVNTQLNIAIMVSHELTHQWFGNLVTPKWWQYLWMNEGFASLFEYLVVSEIYWEYRVMENFAVSHFLRALLNDGQKNPRAMSAYVETPAQISGLFDSVTYSKAGCVLRMFQHVLGPAKFQQALSNYLKEYSHGVVDEDDLFKHFKAVADGGIAGLPFASLEAFFKSWTNQGGYPVLTVTRDYASGSFEIMQEFFDNTNKPSKNVSWIVPFNYIYGDNANFYSTSPDGFLNMESSVTVKSMNSSSKANEWLLLNKQLTGYYRVNYDLKNWELLTKQLHDDHTKIHVMNRVQLIDDSIRLAFAGRLSSTVGLRLIEYLRKEKNYAPWAAANNVFNALNTYLLGDKEYRLFEYYVGKLVSPIYANLGTTETTKDTMHSKLARNIAINWACKANVEDCADQTNKRLNDVITSQEEVEPSLKAAIFCNGLLKGGEKEFYYVLHRILNSTDQAERRQLMPTLGCSKNETLLMAYAKTSITYSSEVNYRAQERVNVLSAIIDKNEVGLHTAIQFLIDNHLAYYNLGSPGFMDSNPLVSIMSSIASRVYSKDLVDEFNALLVEVRKGPLGTSTQLDSMKSRAESNLNWMSENRENYVKWLNTFRNNASSTIISSITLVFTVFITLKNYL